MLYVHRSASGRHLATALADLLREPSGDAFSQDVVVVPAKGVERWLTQRLSHDLGAAAGADGVCARVDLPSPATLLDEAAASVLPGLRAAGEAWQLINVVWPLVEALDACTASAVRHYLDGSEARRYGLASRLAQRFTAYAADRPELLKTWAAGTDEAPPDLAWQPQLWRQVRDHVGISPAELHDQACQALKDNPEAVDLPDRLAIYGVTRIRKTRLQVLTSLAEHRDVHFFIHHAGQPLWDAVASDLNHPLLASLSRDVRELQQRLVEADPGLQTDVFDSDNPEDTLLLRLQGDLQKDRVPTDRHELLKTDRSVQVHACHGAARQVEVLREAVLQILEDDPSLEPRDVLVMCPDVETYAPLVKAVFDTDSHPGGRLRISIADRSPRQTNPLLGLAARLLDLAASRVTGAQVLDLAGSPAVRRRFGFSDDDVEQLRGWTVETYVNWGLDADHREPWGLKGLSDGTWRTGLDRLLSGIAIGGTDSAYHGVLPLEGVDSTDIALAGRFAELVDRLDTALTDFTERRSAAKWMDALENAVTALGDTPWDGEWQWAQLARELGEIRTAAAASTAELTLTDVRVMLEERLAGRPTRTSFRTGGMTVCTLTPMRSVPHRVICLLGMDDTAFPRHGIPDGDDILARDPHPGERDPRSEDRQLFLDAILAAEQHLVITYTGNHVRTGEQVPPAVPVGELLDALDLTAMTSDKKPAREQIVIRHPLQPFDARNFTPGELGTTGPFSFDTSSFAGAQSTLSGPKTAPAFLPQPLGEHVGKTVSLQHLKDFLEHPAKAFLRQRLDVYASTRDEQPSDAIPLELDNLQQWGVGERVLRARLRGADPAELLAAEHARGQLPPGALGGQLMVDIGQRVDALVAAATPYLQGDEDRAEVDLRFAEGVSLTGSVPGLRGGTLVHLTYSTLGAKQRLRAWVDLLALSATLGGDGQVVVIGRNKDDAAIEVYGPVPQEAARQTLEHLLALRAVGVRTPLALPIGAASKYAACRREGMSASEAKSKASQEWETSFKYDKEDRDADNRMVWGDGQPFATIWDWETPLALPPGAGGETTPFARLACSVWYPIFAAEVRP